jgi:hypothetical protein
MDDFLRKYETEENKNFVKQALNEAYASYLSLITQD